jgi:hypothetical protein
MKRILSLGLALVAIVTLAAFPAQDAVSPARAVTAPIHLIGVIPLPGNPLVTSDIIWVDPGTKRLYVTDRSNFGIDIVDAENNLFVGRITGFAGPETSRGDPIANATAPPPNGEGPSGVAGDAEQEALGGRWQQQRARGRRRPGLTDLPQDHSIDLHGDP